mgnify:FL=1
MRGFQESQNRRNARSAYDGLNMTKAKFKVKYCRECGETWILTWDEGASRIFDDDFYFFDFDYEFHKVFHTTKKLLGEIAEFLNWQKEMEDTCNER